MGSDLHTPVPEGWVKTGEHRLPRKGEWYLSPRHARPIYAAYNFRKTKADILVQVPKGVPKGPDPTGLPTVGPTIIETTPPRSFRLQFGTTRIDLTEDDLKALRLAVLRAQQRR